MAGGTAGLESTTRMRTLTLDCPSSRFTATTTIPRAPALCVLPPRAPTLPPLNVPIHLHRKERYALSTSSPPRV
jgi:hypothetical protein